MKIDFKVIHDYTIFINKNTTNSNRNNEMSKKEKINEFKNKINDLAERNNLNKKPNNIGFKPKKEKGRNYNFGRLNIPNIPNMTNITPTSNNYNDNYMNKTSYNKTIFNGYNTKNNFIDNEKYPKKNKIQFPKNIINNNSNTGNKINNFINNNQQNNNRNKNNYEFNNALHGNTINYDNDYNNPYNNDNYNYNNNNSNKGYNTGKNIMVNKNKQPKSLKKTNKPKLNNNYNKFLTNNKNNLKPKSQNKINNKIYNNNINNKDNDDKKEIFIIDLFGNPKDDESNEKEIVEVNKIPDNLEMKKRYYRNPFRDSLAQKNMQLKEIKLKIILTKEEYILLMREKAKFNNPLIE